MEKLNKKVVEEAYYSEGNAAKAAKKLGIKTWRMYKLIREHNIPALYHRKYDVDDDFFSRDNEASFYWAGFLAADGNVSVNNACKKPTVVRLKISTRDQHHLEEFKRALKAEAPIKIVSNWIRPQFTYCNISISSEKMVNDLKERFNIVPRKSLKYTFPKWLIKHPMVHHFMRGYSDGDGCFSRQVKANRVLFDVLGTKSFLSDYQFVLIRECNPKYNNTVRKHNNSTIHHLQFGGNLIVNRIAKFLYKDATVFLERKKEIAFYFEHNPEDYQSQDKLTKEQVITVKQLIKLGKGATAIGRETGIERHTVARIRDGK